MLKAIDFDNRIISIDDAICGNTYYCPICSCPLIQRRGGIRIPHFAHRSSINGTPVPPCTDHWHYDKTDWHVEWQKRFPVECYECVITNQAGEKHFADVLINNTVIEFQHSNISREDFEKRNSFYLECGFKVIWVFDFIEDYKKGKFRRYGNKSNCYFWSYPKKPFKDLDFLSKEIIVFFQFFANNEASDKNNHVKELEKISEAYNHFINFSTDNTNALSVSEFIELIKKNHFPPHNTTENELTQKNIIQNAKKGKTIPDLWYTIDYKIVVRNLYSNEEVEITGVDGIMNRDANSKILMGKYLNNSNNQLQPILDANCPIWELIEEYRFK